MLKQMLVRLVAPLLLALPAIAVADVITFDHRFIDPFDLAAGAQTEGAFEYQAKVGEGWEVRDGIGKGDGASALVTFFNDQNSNVGDVVEIKLTGGGTFSFVSVDFRTLKADGAIGDIDTASITGYLGGVLAGTLSLDTPTFPFQTAPSGFSDSIDLLRIQVTTPNNAGTNALILDNFTFAVPEPSTLALMLIGALFAFQRRKTR